MPRKKQQVEISSRQEVRDLTTETKEIIIAVQENLKEEWGFKPSINATLNYILHNGGKFILNN